jgi:hypothetical protein
MRKEGSRRWPRWPHHPQARPRVARAARWCGPLMVSQNMFKVETTHLYFNTVQDDNKKNANGYKSNTYAATVFRGIVLKNVLRVFHFHVHIWNDNAHKFTQFMI